MICNENRLTVMPLDRVFQRSYSRQIQNLVPADQQLVVPAQLLNLFVGYIAKRGQFGTKQFSKHDLNSDTRPESRLLPALHPVFFPLGPASRAVRARVSLEPRETILGSLRSRTPRG